MAVQIADGRRIEPDFMLPERAMLEGWLEYQRATLLIKCEGLDDARHNGHADLIRELLDGAVGR